MTNSDETSESDSNGERDLARCGATCRDGSPCEAYPVDGTERCRMHGGLSSGPPRGNQNATRHGLYADPANVLDDLAESDPEAYEWVLKKYDSYLDSAPFEDGSAKADQLRHVAVQEYIIWRATGHQLADGLVVDSNESDGDAYGDVLKSHPVNNPLDRMIRTVSSRLDDLGVLDDDGDPDHTDEDGEKLDAIRTLMQQADTDGNEDDNADVDGGDDG